MTKIYITYPSKYNSWKVLETIASGPVPIAPATF